ncbi:hypothetical protein Tco_0171056, partial [Tanacetum coccineum]
GKKKTTPKADKPVKPAPAKRPKHVKEKISKPSPAKQSRKGKVQKVRKEKSPLKLIDEDGKVHHEPEPQGKGEDFNLNRAIQMSLETFQAHGQAPVGGVAIHKPVAKATHQLFVRRTPTIIEESTRPSAQPQDDTSANIVRDTLSPVDAETGADTYITTSITNTE